MKGGRCSQIAIVYTVTPYLTGIGQELIKYTVIEAAKTPFTTKINTKSTMQIGINREKNNGNVAPTARGPVFLSGNGLSSLKTGANTRNNRNKKREATEALTFSHLL